MCQCSVLVDEYLECGIVTEYYLVQLLTTLNLKKTYQPIDHSSMTTVISYRAPYLINNTSSLILPFLLGDDAALRSVIGIHCLLTMGQRSTCSFGTQSSVYVAV